MEFSDIESDKRVNRQPSKLDSGWAREFSFQGIETALREKAPFSWKMMCALGGVKEICQQHEDGDDSDIAPGNILCQVESDEEEAGENDNTSDDEQDPRKQKRKRKRPRDQKLMITTAMAILLSCQNQKLNYFQTMVALTAQAYDVPKRVLTLLNHFGVAVSYGTIVRIENITAEANMMEIQKLATQPTGAAYDNLVKEQNVEEETMDNRSSLYKLTVNLVWQLKVPSLITTERQLIQGQLMRNLCFKDPDYDNADPLDILGLHNLGEFLRPQIEGLICETLWRLFGEHMQKNVNLPGRRKLQRPVIYKIEPRIDELFIGPTLGIDPGTVTGNIEVLEAIGQLLGIDQKDMVDKVMPVVGDMTTVIMMRHAKEYRKRDMEYNRFQHVDPWAGFLHTLFGKWG